MHEALRLLAEGDGIGRLVQEHDGSRGAVAFLNLLVLGGAGSGVGFLLRLREHLVHALVPPLRMLRMDVRVPGGVGRDLAGVGNVVGPRGGAHGEVLRAVAGGAGGVVHQVDAQLDADLSPHLLDDGQVVGLVRVAGQGQHGGLEPAGEPGLRQQGARLGRVVLVKLLAREQRRRGGHEGAHRLAQAQRGDADHRVLVDGVVQRLAHLGVRHGVGLAVLVGRAREHRQIGDAGGGPQLHAQRRVRLQLLDPGVRHELRAVDLPGLELQQPGGVVGNDGELKLVEVRQRLAVLRLLPVVRVAPQRHRNAALPGGQHERAGADRVLGERPRLVLGRLARRRLEQLLRHDGGVEGRERRDDRRVRVLQRDRNGAV